MDRGRERKLKLGAVGAKRNYSFPRLFFPLTALDLGRLLISTQHRPLLPSTTNHPSSSPLSNTPSTTPSLVTRLILLCCLTNRKIKKSWKSSQTHPNWTSPVLLPPSASQNRSTLPPHQLHPSSPRQQTLLIFQPQFRPRTRLYPSPLPTHPQSLSPARLLLPIWARDRIRSMPRPRK